MKQRSQARTKWLTAPPPASASHEYHRQVWRQPDATSPGRLVAYPLNGVSEDMSLLEMLDVLNEGLTMWG
jgi:succinate dehydrogenase / fumarate reductase iron-sulfur subunit